MAHWAFDAIFYHVYPLGLCGAPARNDFTSAPVPRLEQLMNWVGHWRALGVNALYLGPVFESTAHGYDTADYSRVDRRLGSNETLAALVKTLHDAGIRVLLDGVFNHVGRDFWAFRDLCARGRDSACISWFAGLDWGQHSPYGDPFSYAGWNGHYDLVKLNLAHPPVREYLLGAIRGWIEQFGIDGLRLDAADCVDLDFWRELGIFCRRLRPDFLLLGEVVHGDYRRWANREALDTVTNYECYKALYSSHVDRNYFEIAYALNRQFGTGGLYRDLPLYNFADNHDVNRVASNLTNPAHLYPLYCLLFTMPGMPSIYYGSEWGIAGRRENGSDHALRPHLDLTTMSHSAPHRDLAPVLSRLARLRSGSAALRRGHYQALEVRHEQLAFSRWIDPGRPGEVDERVIVLVNAAAQPAAFDLPVPGGRRPCRLVDVLNEGQSFPVVDGRARVDPVWPHWARVLAVQSL